LRNGVQVSRQLVCTVRQKRVANSSAEISSARRSRGLSVRCYLPGGVSVMRNKGAFGAARRRMASAMSASMRASSLPDLIGQLALCQLAQPLGFGIPRLGHSGIATARTAASFDSSSLRRATVRSRPSGTTSTT